LPRSEAINLIRDYYPKDDPEQVLKKLCEEGVFFEVNGMVRKA
jgi:hypothetical protein